MTEAQELAKATPTQNTWRGIGSVIPTVLDALQEAHAGRHSGRTLGLTTGMDALDQATGGLKGGQLVWLASPLGLGLGQMARQWMQHVAMREALAVVYCTFRSTAEHIAQCLIATLASVPHQRMARGLTHAHEMSKIVVAAETMRKLPITFICGKGLTVKEYANRVAHLDQSDAGASIGLMIIEDMALFAQEPEDSQDLADVMRQLSALAQKLNCVLLILAQAPDPVNLDESQPGMIYRKLGLYADAANLVDWAMYLTPRLDLSLSEQSVTDLEIVFGRSYGEGVIRCLWREDGGYASLGAVT